MPKKKLLHENNLHHSLIVRAEVEVMLHVEVADGEKCFNLFTFIGRFANIVMEMTNDEAVRLDRYPIARYIWCCLTRFKDETPSGTTFRGMPILN